MKKIATIINLMLITIVLAITMISMLSMIEQNTKVEAASNSGNTSDVQLLARAINRRG